MGKRPQVAEITLSAAWHAGAVPAQLETVDGVSLEIVHRGRWTTQFRTACSTMDR